MVLKKQSTGLPVHLETQSMTIRAEKSGQEKKVYLFIGSSIGLWMFAVVLSQRLAGKELSPNELRGRAALASGAATSGQGAETDEGTVLVSPESARLRKAVETQPENRELLLQLAASLQADAKARPSPGLVMEAVQAYTKILKNTPDDPDALLGLASLCFEAEIIDKAVEYFAKYLQKRPNDLQASTDYSLALIQGGDPEKAIAFLSPLAEKYPERFQMRLTLAVAEKLRGNKERALAEANRALEKAPTEDARKHIQEFLASLASDAPANGGNSGSLSPASVVEQYFQNHPIIGPKLVKITWPSANQVKVFLRDFPVEQMPPMARDKFLSSATKALSVIPDAIEIDLVDSATEKPLLHLSAGAQAPSGESQGPGPAGPGPAGPANAGPSTTAPKHAD